MSAPIQVVEVVWKDARAPLPPAAKVAVLEGNPSEVGLFTMRLRVPAGSVLPLHRHATDERITVLAGQACVTIESETCFPTGSYYVTPAGVPHTVRFPDETVLQATGVGPWTFEPLTVRPPTNL